MFTDFFYNFANFFLVQATNVVPVTQATDIPLPKPVGANPLLIFFEVVYALLCLVLIILIMMQTSKAEGLAGIMGGSMQNLFRGKQSVEQKLSKITSAVAIVFVLMSVVICYVINHNGI